ncbi:MULTISPECIES: ATPase, T2SS/T4P/T4SS family [unclassified Corallococcus]|uniref:ATPase, T2SS/T4P/T4SS family n=1 Tax=unclassified Corallococcus TaxID=2685029 RepID=UPI001A8D4808|nr:MULTISPECIES: ATPase, T2SS/T4P/T4SS family [unclassified Corallococcus]MBN9682350.1 Flp pilus assembly complex ATPase component TadA [Corallococcus sp. NCSPR001]WAS86098.1 ATPase, T2SS/T4P/T4SS family [Corallococcus sp. NCRR]
MTTLSPESEAPATPEAVFASLLQKLGEAGRAPSGAAASPRTPEALAAALFDIAGRAGAAMFSVWAADDTDSVVDEDDGDEARAETGGRVINAGITLFFIEKDTPGTVGLLGAERVPVRQPMAYELYRPLGKALTEYAKRGADPVMPDRGHVAFPVGAVDPDLEFRVSFREDALGTWTTALARDRETRQAYPSITSLPLSAEAAVFLKGLFNRLDKTLFNGQVVLLTGASNTGRSTTLRAVMDALPDNVHALAAVEEPKGGPGGAIGVVKVGGELKLVQALRSFLRQDPDLVFADEVRTLEDMRMLCTASQTGHATVCVLEAKTPEEGYAWLTEAMPGTPVHSLIVHHTRDAAGALAMTLHETKPTEDGDTLHVVPWTPAA